MLCRLKPSRMETRLKDIISGATSQLRADCASAELAAYWARVGRFDDARVRIASLRKTNERNPQIELSIWLHLSEGLLSYFSEDGVTDSDGVQRAYALSTAAGIHEMRALSAAWLAQWDYTKINVKDLVFHIQEALSLAGPENHACRSRASLVVAQMLHLAGRFDLAQSWYKVSRDHAIAGFDGATIGALIHNMAWQRMLLFRQAVLTNKSDISAGRHALLNAESASHFEQMTGDASWPKLNPILRAQIISLGGDAARALPLYIANLSEESIPGRWQANLLADKAWCHAMLNQNDQANSCAQRALENVAIDTQLDDKAATHSRVSQAYYLLGNIQLANYHQSISQKMWIEFSAMMLKAVEGLSQLDENGRSKIQAN